MLKEEEEECYLEYKKNITSTTYLVVLGRYSSILAWE